MDPAPELLYVNSKIVEPSKLSPELFTSWYNDVHIPDIFETSGIKQAFRYFTTAEDPSRVERPYLALYPIRFQGYLQSAEFYAIPVKSDVLPGPNNEIFDVADFDTRYYASKSQKNAYAGPYLLTVEVQGDKASSALEETKSVAHYQCYFSRQNRKAPEQNEIGTPPTDLVLLWHESQEELDKAAESYSNLGKVTSFKLLKDFVADK